MSLLHASCPPPPPRVALHEQVSVLLLLFQACRKIIEHLLLPARSQRVPKADANTIPGDEPEPAM